MITRNALYSFIDNLVENAAPSSALYGAVVARNLRTSVDDARRVIRVDCWGGKFALVSDSQLTEQDADSSVQCFSTPTGDTADDLDDAIDDSFEMAKEVYLALASDSTGLGGMVCNTDFEDFETDVASLGSVERGCTYLYGKVNP